MELPLQKSENLHLEFKRADVLKNLSNVARAVVGFLNTEGGVLWIGIGENEAGFADSIQPVQEAPRERTRVQDALTDLIEPAPTIGSEVLIDLVSIPKTDGQHVLCLQVKPGRRAPYMLRQASPPFLRRTGSRLRPMTREEIKQAFESAEKGRAESEDATYEVEAELEEELKKKVAPGTALRFIIQPVSDLQLGLNARSLEPYLRDPGLTGNRPLGWNFASSYSELRTNRSGFQFGDVGSVQWLRLDKSGRIEFGTVHERLHWSDEPGSLWPFVLMELPVSVARLARTLYSKFAAESLQPGDPIVMALALYGIGDWTLRPRSPNSIEYQVGARKKYSEVNSLGDFFSTPSAVSWKDLADRPDACALRHVRDLYYDFGYDDEKFPIEFDPVSGRLVFPP